LVCAYRADFDVRADSVQVKEELSAFEESPSKRALSRKIYAQPAITNVESTKMAIFLGRDIKRRKGKISTLLLDHIYMTNANISP
jgi:hypothetical protein